MRKNIQIILLQLLTPLICGFPTSTITGWDNVYTRTHRDMLEVGLRKAVGHFLLENNYFESDMNDMALPLIVDTFFGNDSDGRKKYANSIDDIFFSMEKQELLLEPHFHCNAEQLLEAHTYIINLRSIIGEMVEAGNPNILLLKEYIGKCLYTLQSFYSSSNWVEMDGNKTYRDFGVPGKTLLTIAADDMDTCSDCNNSRDINSCKDNLLITNMLTSGYHSKQDILPPRRAAGVTSGKCGFGGSSDNPNGYTTAKGGINKDQKNPSYSPHYQLHFKAYSAANEATFQFLIDPEIGIINELTHDVFAKLFQLYKRRKGSLGFAIDVTGSMRNEIDEVKTYCIDYITTVRGTANEPTDYILTKFSDPESLTKLVLKTNDGIEMITTINSLDLDNGFDCPEYSIGGLIACIEACQPFSTIFVFTDADAKDEIRKDDVLDLAVNKNVTVLFVLTGKCSRKRRSVDRNKRQTSVYDEVAHATGGMVYRINTSEIFAVMQKVIEQRFPSASAIIDTFWYGNTSDNYLTINVDSFVQNIRIVITGPNDTKEVDLTEKQGSMITSGAATVLFVRPDTVILTAVNPKFGNYIIERKEVRDWLVNITAQTILDFKYYILERNENGNWYRTTENPLLGENYTIQVAVLNQPDANFSISKIVLTNSKGIKEHLRVTIVSSEDTTFVYAKKMFNLEEYQVSIVGFDDEGYEFLRTSSKKITVVNVQLKTLSPSELFVGAVTIIPYTITNYGAANNTFVVSFTDATEFLIGPVSETFTLSTGGSVSGSFEMQSQLAFTTVTYSIDVHELGSNLLLQKERKSVFALPNNQPACTVHKVVGNCSRKFEEGSCSSNVWFGQAKITFVSALSYIKATPSLNMEFDSQNLLSSPFYVNASGTCCSATPYLIAIDINNNMIKCYFNLGHPIYVSLSQQNNISEKEKIAIGLVACIFVLCVIVIVFIAIFIFRVGIKPKLKALKIHDFNIKVSTNLPTRSDNITKERFNGHLSFLKTDCSNTLPYETGC